MPAWKWLFLDGWTLLNPEHGLFCLEGNCSINFWIFSLNEHINSNNNLLQHQKASYLPPPKRNILCSSIFQHICLWCISNWPWGFSVNKIILSKFLMVLKLLNNNDVSLLVLGKRLEYYYTYNLLVITKKY